MAIYNRWTILIFVILCVGITTPIRGQDLFFEVDERVPTGDCPLCIGVPRFGVITGVEDIQINGGASPTQLHQGALVDEAILFIDRDGHIVHKVPKELVGADYIAASQNNADDVVTNGGEIDIAIDVVEGGVVYVFVDSPEIVNNGGSLPFEWMANPDEWDGNVFFDTGSSFAGFEGEDPGPGDRQFYIYGVGPLDGGTYHLREQDVDSSFYSAAALFGGDPDTVFPPVSVGGQGEIGNENVNGSFSNLVFTEPGEVTLPGLGQSWYAVGNPGDKEGVDAIAEDNDRVVPYFHGEEGTWWTGSADALDVQKYPADFDGLLATDNFLSEGYDQYTVKLEGEIRIEESGTIRFLDGVDDYTYFAIDTDRSGVAGDSDAEVLLNDDNWTDVLAVENDDDGPSPIVEVDFQDIAEGGEWLAMEFNVAEGEGGDAGVLYWDALDEDGFFPTEQGEGLQSTDDIALLQVPDTHLRGPETPATVVSGEVTGTVPARSVGWEVDVNPADGTSDTFVLANLGDVRDEIDADDVTTILDVEGTELHINALGEVSEGDSFQVFVADSITGTPIIATEGWSFDASTGSIVFGDVVSTCESLAASRIAGDADGNGEVAFSDFLALANNFGTDAGYEGGDFDCNGEVAFNDFLALANNFGATAASGAASSVPEPSGFALLGLTVMFVGLLRRRS